ncbi:MAG: S8 family serine peptidase [Candidatus Nanopelagicaceae bacterium]
MRKPVLIVVSAIAFSLVSPAPVFADVDPIQAALNKVMPELPLAPSHPALTTAREQIGADWTIEHGYTGQGVSVVVMDEGTQAAHVQLDGRIIQEVCTSSDGLKDLQYQCKAKATLDVGVGAAEYKKNEDGTPYRDSAHGTMVSSAVLEFAPSVRIISLKFNQQSTSPLDWIAANAKKYNIAAVNMSFGADWFPRTFANCGEDTGYQSWMTGIKKIKAQGVAVVVASGNGGRLTQISHPACEDAAISVGAVLPTDKFTNYSNVAQNLTLAAPTEFESATVPQDPTKLDEWTNSFGGTSAAAPVIAAMMAIGHSVSPTSTVDELTAIARSTATSIDDVVIKDLRRVNFDKFVQKILNLKALGSIKSISSSNLTEKSVTLSWTVGVKPAKVRITVNGQTPQLLPGDDGEIVLDKLAASNDLIVKVEAIEADGTVTSIKELSLTFPVSNLGSWCNPTGKLLAIRAPNFGHYEILGVNKLNAKLVDLGLGIQNATRLSCTYIEFSPADSPSTAYIARLITGSTTDRHTMSIPIDFGTSGVLRITLIDKNGDYSNVTTYYFPKGSFSTAGESAYESGLERISVDYQPELLGVIQKSLLLDKSISADFLALGDFKSAVSTAEELAKTQADAALANALAKAVADAEIAKLNALAKVKAEADLAAAVAKIQAEAALANALSRAAADAEVALVNALAKASAEANAIASANAKEIASLKAEFDIYKKVTAKTITITCIKGKLTLLSTGTAPKCPTGWKVKK